MSKNVLKSLGVKVTSELKEQGFLRNNIRERIQDKFFPWLYENVREAIDIEDNKHIYGDNFVDDLRKDVERSHRAALQQEKNRKIAILEEREKIKKVFFKYSLKKYYTYFSIKEKEEARKVRMEIKRLRKISQEKYMFMSKNLINF